MSKEERKALESLKSSIRQNEDRVEKKLSESGITPDPALVYSAAKYYETLKRLSKE